MKNAHIVAALGALVLSSCAYMQSHKNIEETSKSYDACRLDGESLSVTRKGGQWYLVAPAGAYTKSYPLFYDSMLLTDSNEPTYKKKVNAESDKTCLLPISAGTAATLQMKNGFYTPQDLALEIQRQMKDRPVLDAQNGYRKYRVTAQKAEADTPVVLTYGSSGEPSLALRTLSTLDFVLVDIPGTVVYNVAIPVMAPFIFFSEFLSSED